MDLELCIIVSKSYIHQKQNKVSKYSIFQNIHLKYRNII